MGILDSKSRILDIILTSEGKRQLSTGKMVVEHISYSDNSTYYNLEKNPEDTKTNFILEANDLPQDQITPETDINQYIRSLNFSSLKVVNGDFLSLDGTLKTNISSSQFNDIVNKNLNSNFNKLQLLKSKNDFDLDFSFKETSNINSINFSVTNNESLNTKNIDNMPVLYKDPDVSFSSLYKFLPPVLPLSGNIEPETIFNYNEPNNNILTDSMLESRILNLNSSKKKTLKFNSSGKTHIQFFQLESNTSMLKLDMIKFGSVLINNVKNEVYFVGRILQNSSNTTTFFRMFTILIK